MAKQRRGVPVIAVGAAVVATALFASSNAFVNMAPQSKSWSGGYTSIPSQASTPRAMMPTGSESTTTSVLRGLGCMAMIFSVVAAAGPKFGKGSALSGSSNRKFQVCAQSQRIVNHAVSAPNSFNAVQAKPCIQEAVNVPSEDLLVLQEISVPEVHDLCGLADSWSVPSMTAPAPSFHAAAPQVSSAPAFGSTAEPLKKTRLPRSCRRVAGERHQSARRAREASSESSRNQRRRIGARLQASPPVYESKPLSFDVTTVRTKIQIGLGSTSSHPSINRHREPRTLACNEGIARNTESWVAIYSFWN
eukprot:TRINITY_DN12333_c0_g2_i1.p1 TRINITY_DN12333_c0_g2~~TRINITY_DN12333_c0_g2_i1.p1  ORF type:complete len:332 (-),score=62.09 TRINITY_DN12333_c0_g2_i1:434-1348(-)